MATQTLWLAFALQHLADCKEFGHDVNVSCAQAFNSISCRSSVLSGITCSYKCIMVWIHHYSLRHSCIFANRHIVSMCSQALQSQIFTSCQHCLYEQATSASLHQHAQSSKTWKPLPLRCNAHRTMLGQLDNKSCLHTCHETNQAEVDSKRTAPGLQHSRQQRQARWCCWRSSVQLWPHLVAADGAGGHPTQPLRELAPGLVACMWSQGNGFCKSTKSKQVTTTFHGLPLCTEAAVMASNCIDFFVFFPHLAWFYRMDVQWTWISLCLKVHGKCRHDKAAIWQ